VTSNLQDSLAAPAYPVAGRRRGSRAAGTAPRRTDAGTPDPTPGVPALTSRSPLPLPPTAPSAAAGMPEPVTVAALSSRAATGRGGAGQAPRITASRAGIFPAAGTQAPAGAAKAVLAGSTSLSAGQRAIAAAMSEDRGPDSLDAHVRRLMKDLGLRGFHAHDARRSEAGYPDWTIAGLGGQMWRELKTQRGKVSPEQQAWLDTLTAGGADARVWRPEHLLSGSVALELAALAGVTGGTA
jgi:hypothetical protein